jgi:hypothetical protein
MPLSVHGGNAGTKLENEREMKEVYVDEWIDEY